jgi:hypothetical protein
MHSSLFKCKLERGKPMQKKNNKKKNRKWDEESIVSRWAAMNSNKWKKEQQNSINEAMN